MPCPYAVCRIGINRLSTPSCRVQVCQKRILVNKPCQVRTVLVPKHAFTDTSFQSLNTYLKRKLIPARVAPAPGQDDDDDDDGDDDGDIGEADEASISRRGGRSACVDDDDEASRGDGVCRDVLVGFRSSHELWGRGRGIRHGGYLSRRS